MKWAFRHRRATVALLGILLVVAGGTAVGFLSVRNLQRIDSVHDRVSDLERLRELRQRLEISLLDEVREAVPSGSFLAEDIRLQVENALAVDSRLDPETAAGLRRIETLLTRPGMVNRESLIGALELAGSISEREARAQGELLRQVREDGRREFYAGILGLLMLAALTTGAAWLLPRRFLDPLAHLRSRLSALGDGHFHEVSLEGVDSALVPLFSNYNALVGRLAELEAERRARAKTLESEVRAGAQALLEQHRVLTDAERMAAVGETAAGLAHELRNPLAGILAVLENMGREVDDPSLSHRLSVVRQEAERMVRLLNEYLAASRHAPESPTETDLGELVSDLLSLLRYQASPEIRLEQELGNGLVCFLPSGRIRQALLNLVVNSLQALGSSPGRVLVSVNQSVNGVTMEVRDDGPGFPDYLLPVAGQPFRTGRAAGTGLGLATVQRTARDLGGSLNIRNLEPKGAAVTLTLPCPAAEGG